MFLKIVFDSKKKLFPPKVCDFFKKFEYIRTEGRHLDNLMIQITRMGNAGVQGDDLGDDPPAMTQADAKEKRRK